MFILLLFSFLKEVYVSGRKKMFFPIFVAVDIPCIEFYSLT